MLTCLLLDGQHFNVVSLILLTYPYHHHCHHQDGYHHHHHQVALRVLCLGKDFDDMPSAFRQVDKNILDKYVVKSFKQIYMASYG